MKDREEEVKKLRKELDSISDKSNKQGELMQQVKVEWQKTIG